MPTALRASAWHGNCVPRLLLDALQLTPALGAPREVSLLRVESMGALRRCQALGRMELDLEVEAAGRDDREIAPFVPPGRPAASNILDRPAVELELTYRFLGGTPVAVRRPRQLRPRPPAPSRWQPAQLRMLLPRRH